MYAPDFENSVSDYSESDWKNDSDIQSTIPVDKTILKGINDREIQYLIGLSYYVGAEYPEGCFEQDFNEAFYWLGKSAKQWNPQAAYLYALMNYLGKGTEPNVELAITWVEKALSIGADALILRGLLAEEAVGRDKTDSSKMRDEAKHWYQLATEEGSVDACVFIASLYRDHDPEINPDAQGNQAEWYKKASDNLLKCQDKSVYDRSIHQKYFNQPTTRLYLQSQLAKKHYDDAFEYLEKIDCDRPEYGDCQNFIGWLYLNGLGVPKYINKSREYFLKGSEGNNAMSIYAVAEKTPSYEERNELYLKAVELGFRPALYALGNNSHEITEQLKWLVFASTQGSVYAMNRLAEIFFEDHAVKLGFEWLRKASERGCFSATDRLARSLHFGTIPIENDSSKYNATCDTDFKRAYSLYKKTDPIAALHFPFRAWKLLKDDHNAQLDWLRIGATQGHAGCQWELAKLYDRNNRIYDAYVLYRSVASQGLVMDCGRYSRTGYDHNQYVRFAQNKLERAKHHFAKARAEYERYEQNKAKSDNDSLG